MTAIFIAHETDTHDWFLQDANGELIANFRYHKTECRACANYLNQHAADVGKIEILLRDMETLQKEKGLLEAAAGARPRIVCICGSSRFVNVGAIMAWEYAKRGIVALGMYLLPPGYEGRAGEVADHGAEAEGVASALDELHLQKIEMADSIMVLNIGGYIGERTAIEIEYAKKLGKPIEYYEARAMLDNA